MESEPYRLLQKHDRDLYHGNGKPGLTTRIALLEECVDKIDEAIQNAARKTDRLTWLVAVGVGILITLQFVLKR